MNDQELVARLREMVAYPAGIPSEAVRELIDICQAEIERGGPWGPERGHDGRDQDEQESDRARASLARSILRVIAKGYSIDWRSDVSPGIPAPVPTSNKDKGRS